MNRLVILILFVITSFIHAEVINIAVNDLKSHGIGKNESAIISERVRSELINTGKFRVMERGEMNMILEEQGFQQSGMCSDASCLVEVGQILAVDRIITGSIGVIGSMYTMNLKMVNVETGEIVATSNVDYHGEIAGFLSQSIAVGVARLQGSQSGATSMDAKLTIYSSPEGADIKINGKEAGMTPLKNFSVTPGEVSLILSKRNFITADSLFFLGEAQKKSITLTLLPEQSSTPKKNKVFKVLGFSVGGAMIAGGVLAGIAFDQQIQSKQKEYDEIRHVNPQQFSDLHNEMDDAALFRNISYIGAGCGAALFSVSFFF